MFTLRDKRTKGASDIAKALIVLGFPFVHAIQVFIGYGYAGDSLYEIAGFVVALTVFGGPIFLTCLGIDLSENRSSKNIIKMGIQMIFITLILNFFRYAIPNMIMVFAGAAPAYWILESILANDIFGFIGMFCIIYGITKRLKCPTILLLVISFIFFALNTYLSKTITVSNEVLSYIVGNFVTGFGYTHFSLLGWCVFPCMGIYIGKIMKMELRRRNLTFGIILLGAAAIFVIYSIVVSGFGSNSIEMLSLFGYDGTYGIMQLIPMMCIALFLLSALYFIYESVPENRFERTLIMNANLALPFYFIHFVILFWIALIPEYILDLMGRPYMVGIGVYLAVSIIVEIVTIIICYTKGFTFYKWLLRVTDYERWFKKKRL